MEIREPKNISGNNGRSVYVYDIESLINFFCVCFLNDEEKLIFEISDRKNEFYELINFLKTKVSGLKGYNNLNYDSQIIEFLLKSSHPVTANDIYKQSQHVIDLEFPEYPEWKLSIPNLDIYRILHLDNKNRRVGLKWCEYMLDWHNIEDMPYEHYQHVNNDQIEEIISYCWNDVYATNELYKKYPKEVDLRRNLTKAYNINVMNYSNSKIGSELLLKLYCKATNKNPKEVKNLRTYRNNIYFKDLIFDCVKFKTKEFQQVYNYYKNIIYNKSTINEKIKFEFILNEVEYVYGLGGIHGSISNKIIEADDDYVIIDADVASLYPSIAIVNNLYPKHLGVEFAKVYNNDVVAVRLAEKAKKENGNKAIVDGFKEVANATYGKSNEETSWLYDPAYTYTTTINGQLMISMLAEELLTIGDLIQINTDGLTMKLHKDNIDKYYQICNDWQKTTGLMLEYAEYKKMFIRDVNNYIAVYTNNKIKRKGTYEYKDLPLHKNKSESIVAIAINEWFINNTPIEQTIKNHNNILDFCIGARTKKGSKFVYYNTKGNKFKLSKTIRYFISNKGVIIKKEYDGGDVEYMNKHPQKGKAFYQALLNKYENTKAQNYDINYNYYIYKVKEELSNIKLVQQKLF